MRNLAASKGRACGPLAKADVLGQFGDNQTTLADFGIEAPKPTTNVSSATKAAAAVKGAATKEVRGTNLGKKQKKSLKGNVQVSVTAVPVVTQPAAAPVTTNAANAAQAAPTATSNAKPNGSGS